jgi:hypothetical protein
MLRASSWGILFLYGRLLKEFGRLLGVLSFQTARKGPRKYLKASHKEGKYI